MPGGRLHQINDGNRASGTELGLSSRLFFRIFINTAYMAHCKFVYISPACDSYVLMPESGLMNVLSNGSGIVTPRNAYRGSDDIFNEEERW